MIGVGIACVVVGIVLLSSSSRSGTILWFAGFARTRGPAPSHRGI